MIDPMTSEGIALLFITFSISVGVAQTISYLIEENEKSSKVSVERKKVSVEFEKTLIEFNKELINVPNIAKDNIDSVIIKKFGRRSLSLNTIMGNLARKRLLLRLIRFQHDFTEVWHLAPADMVQRDGKFITYFSLCTQRGHAINVLEYSLDTGGTRGKNMCFTCMDEYKIAEPVLKQQNLI